MLRLLPGPKINEASEAGRCFSQYSACHFLHLYAGQGQHMRSWLLPFIVAELQKTLIVLRAASCG